MNAIFANGTSVEYLRALETEEYWGGSSRRTLTFTCEPDAVSVDDLNEVLSDTANTQALTLVGALVQPDGIQQPVTNIYEGYTMKLKVGIDKELVQSESPDAPAVYADRLIFKLGKPTFIEQQLAKLGLGVNG